MPVTSKAMVRTVRAEKALLCFTLVVHTLIALLVSLSPSSFGNAAYYLIALSGLVYCNAVHWARAHDLIRGATVVEAITVRDHHRLHHPAAGAPSGSEGEGPSCRIQRGPAVQQQRGENGDALLLPGRGGLSDNLGSSSAQKQHTA